MSDLTLQKKLLRNEIRTLKKQQSKEDLRAQSDEITRKLLADSHILDAQIIAMYYPLPDEVDVASAMNELYSDGKGIYLPHVVSDGKMVFCRYKGQESLRKGAFGIMETIGETLNCLDNISVIIVPGMAFDADGNRLGRGKGYYDRMLMSMPNTYKIGVCFNFQMVDNVPAEPFDIKMNAVIS
jgi:5-formyltetrahydrofolate cyclo-ligase